MKNRRTGLDLMILLEVIILVLVLILGVLKPGLGQIKKKQAKENTEEQAWEITTEEVQETDKAKTIADMDISEPITFSEEVQKKLKKMSDKEKVAQLFITTPEQLTDVDQVTIAGEGTEKALKKYPVAGLIYSEQNLIEQEQIRNLIQGTRDYGKEQTGLRLFMGVAESGGQSASPLAKGAELEITPSPEEILDSEEEDALSGAVSTRCNYLKDIGFNMVLGPHMDLADKTSEEHDALTYGSDALAAADYIQEEITAMQSGDVMCAVMSFPGEAADQEDYTVCQAAVDTGVQCIIMSNLASQTITGKKNLPCALSAAAAQKLRKDMGYEGLLMTSDLAGKNITKFYKTSKAAVKAVQAGENLLYVTKDFKKAYQAVLKAVKSGEITETVLNNAVGRVLEAKME